MAARMATRVAVLALALAAGCSSAEPGLAELSTDPAFVVELHASRGALEAAALPETARRQLMTTASGQQFECFLPPLGGVQAETGGSSSSTDEAAALLAFGRAASRQIRPTCVQFVDVAGEWVFEVCPGVLVRKVSLKAGAEGEGDSARSHQVVELGAFERDGSEAALAFSDFVGTETQARVRGLQRPLYTQRFTDKEGSALQVQFMCGAAGQDDLVAGVQWSAPSSPDEERRAASFLVAARVFCDTKHMGVDEEEDLPSVHALLQPLVEANTCVKRNEGWWTYEFCFGQGIRQYHRDSDGRITAEFSLGTLDAERNAELEQSGGALVSEHVDATHDVARPAFLELYGHGTFCKEFDNHAPREARVYYYCSQGGTSHHILTVKEIQTCAYTLKVSSPALCDHPHFLNDDLRGNDEPSVVHCVPLQDEPHEQ